MVCPLLLILSVCLALAQPIDAHEDAHGDVVVRRHNVADYIQAGLGATVTPTAAHYDAATTGTSSPTFLDQSSGNNLAALATCAASWSAYNNQATTNVGFTAITYTTTFLINTTIVYGTGAVYTSYGNIPVVAGPFTPTRTANRLLNVSTTTFSPATTTFNPTLVTETPACSFSPKDCSRLYVSYLSSLGLPHNASVPKITPAPENSPHCPAYYYKPFITTYASTRTDLTANCKLYGNSVELFYFPRRTEGPEPTKPVTYKYKEGITFTSPYIYLSFDYISATRYNPLTLDSYSVSCGIQGCLTQAVGGGGSLEDEGTMISGQILTMDPSDVSSIVLNYNTAKASGIISTVVGNLPGYPNIGHDIHLGAVMSASLTAERLKIEDLVHPPPRAYYLRPEGAPGCESLVHSPRCATIFEADYRAIISLPSKVSLLQGAWRTCNPAIYGVYDPPIALTERASVAKPTLPHGITPPAQETTPAPTPYTINPPFALPANTALGDNLPSSTKSGPHAASESGGNNNNNNNNNSGQPGAPSSKTDQSGPSSYDRPATSSRIQDQTDASSSTSTSVAVQTGSSSRLAAHWILSAGTVIFAMSF